MGPTVPGSPRGEGWEAQMAADALITETDFSSIENKTKKILATDEQLNKTLRSGREKRVHC